MDLSNAIIGINTIETNRIHNPKVQCLPNLLAKSKFNIIANTTKTGGINIHKNRRPGLPQILNIKYIL